jgi:hypothetical protein
MVTIDTKGHASHAPSHEFLKRRLISYKKASSCVETMLHALHEAELGSVMEPRGKGLEPILAMHTPAYPSPALSRDHRTYDQRAVAPSSMLGASITYLVVSSSARIGISSS